MAKNKTVNCHGCGAPIANKDEIGICKKMLGKETRKFYCLNCLADYFGCTTEELLEKIEEFKEDGCTLFA